MSALTDPPISAAALLFGGDPAEAIAQRIADGDTLADARAALGGVADDLWSGTAGQVSAIAADFCALDVGSVLASVWQKHDALYDAADRTRATTESEIVPLGSRTVSIEQRPAIDVTVDGHTVHVIRFMLSVEVEVECVSATVARGAVVAVGGGRCEVTVTFGAAGTTLAEKRVGVDPKLTFRIGAPIVLPPRQRRPARLRQRAQANAGVGQRP
jgi:hypothetical protein